MMRSFLVAWALLLGWGAVGGAVAQHQRYRTMPYVYGPANGGSPYPQNPFGNARSGVAPPTDQGVNRGGFLNNPAGVRGGGVDDQLRP